jgi:hypothetical protein
LPFPKGRVNSRRFKKIFEFSAVSEGKGKLEKMSIWTSSIYFAPATAAAPLVIPFENRFIMDLWY